MLLESSEVSYMSPVLCGRWKQPAGSAKQKRRISRCANFCQRMHGDCICMIQEWPGSVCLVARPGTLGRA